jgi:hypothetical protein
MCPRNIQKNLYFLKLVVSEGIVHHIYMFRRMIMNVLHSNQETFIVWYFC